MYYEGTLRVSAAKEKVYSFITDPKRVVTVIPDVIEPKKIDDDHFSVRASFE